MALTVICKDLLYNYDYRRAKLWKLIIRQISKVKYDYPRSKFNFETKDCGSQALIDIIKDVPRTYQHDEAFKCDDTNLQKTALFQILVAYAISDSEIGYTQGMNFVAATFLKVIKDPYDAYLVLQYVMRVLNWRCVYLHNTPKLANLLEIVQIQLYN